MNSTAKGDRLEEQVFKDLKSLIDNDEFLFKKEFCRIYRKKRYYSKARDDNIEFDISIEVFMPNMEEYSFLFLTECKNYNHAVPVNDVEEFIIKVAQVAGHNVKGVFATASAFQTGAKKVAEHYKLGHIRYFSDTSFKWELPRTPSGTLVTSLAPHEIAQAITSEAYESRTFDYFMWSARGHTNSMLQFFKDLIAGQGIPIERLQHLMNLRSTNRVPFLSKAEIEGMASTYLAEAGYTSGKVALNHLRRRLPALTHVRIHRQISRPDNPRYEDFLARADFQYGVIDVYKQAHQDIRQERFTVAHEFSHFLLGHGNYMHREMCEEQDFLLNSPIGPISDIARMEFQANHLASCTLMPGENFYYRFLNLARQHRLYRGNKAILYLDKQSCNIQLFKIVTSTLSRDFEVTRRMAAIRLEGMGLLKDDRHHPSLAFTDLLGEFRKY
ncbi:ImmA/IrrE family metallo-endopeptidase [Deinococcus budaensis]|uniref:Zn-dependent peptidase ImmA (M78 family) n=1 Tax=Deinococcus budaensis TaxID=1665626 RepID=A0A7W8GCD3_9DEIO|nr:Zn-dependent peptidase ImmA (M78 family) [Deinococcus budaensis]